MAFTFPPYPYTIVHIPEYAITGWFDFGAYKLPTQVPALSPPPGPTSWFNRELTDAVRGAGITTLDILPASFFTDPDVIPLLQGDGSGTPNGTPIPNAGTEGGFLFLDAGVSVEVTAILFDDPDTFFTPIAIRALKQSDQMLKNEVRRIR